MLYLSTSRPKSDSTNHREAKTNHREGTCRAPKWPEKFKSSLQDSSDLHWLNICSICHNWYARFMKLYICLLVQVGINMLQRGTMRKIDYFMLITCQSILESANFQGKSFTSPEEILNQTNIGSCYSSSTRNSWCCF